MTVKKKARKASESGVAVIGTRALSRDRVDSARRPLPVPCALLVLSDGHSDGDHDLDVKTIFHGDHDG